VRRHTRETLLTIGRITAASMVLSGVFGGLAGPADDPWRGTGIGVFFGTLIASSLMTIELYVLRGPLAPQLRRLPLLPALLVRAVIYVALTMVIFKIGFWLFLGIPLHAHWLSQAMLESLAFCSAMSIAVNLFQSIDSLLGRRVLTAFLLGRYHRPRLEQRIVMVLDLEGSTALAERLGSVRFLEYLDQFFRDLAAPVIEHGGEIYKYIGDGVIVTWTLRNGVAESNALRAWLAICAPMERRALPYQRRFGAVPRFRAGLHVGEVVVGEMGEDRREIAHLGDTLNTAARLEQACRERNRRLLVSGELLASMAPPAEIAVEPLGEATLRGREKPIMLYNCTRRASGPVPEVPAARRAPNEARPIVTSAAS
jgi:class 3 adenylate cyclase